VVNLPVVRRAIGDRSLLFVVADVVVGGIITIFLDIVVLGWRSWHELEVFEVLSRALESLVLDSELVG
jgi:hypothetical protein